MLEGEAIAAFRASPLHGGTTKIVVVVCYNVALSALAGLAIWPRLDSANTLGNTDV